ncbi:glycoside hydrolase family 3 N-terminal domain-containing protein [Flavobacterium johnsoniae]|jgi:beta-glucosidase|uniref:Periplasmic beta-glucosidase n=2 Tax=Flavobacterium johnsoniae TaxID=986 RepID=A0A1M5GDM2_FLAJO|nr:glycoside hydrolase family 3 N-terminal domain-containing protein [Flavobacterium johnsoniae]ABQ04599.1 Candidate beta-glucosidase; Glycoside hydrolase family 3 [Flavobacterium johnsoniae UW101]OXE97921.1 beta-glucosidase [Flavobacterium johnsoniae UW101]WQG83605.1 glycoside hydrolase family 3 N-terminal domain-containing protein [Flavobacterium johnsoniae UW101]SHG01814.1 beta-glucosidase [Flavobacterium johnsoniae]SHK27441.1 beta-glucosidase [Flavobacterium johnsoniae]
MKKVTTITLFMLSLFASAQQQTIDQKVNDLLKKMTIEEKIGQLNQYTGDNQATGPITINPNKQSEIKAGLIGSMLNIIGTKYTRQYQELAMQSRLKIPLLFGQDVIHGYKTTFPLPLAEAASWDLQAIELAARVAATEASASGIHWTFAPMVDISRDPRWGRVMEGAGEDTYLGSKIAYARVKGFQGNKLGDLNSVMACVKHFAAYGAGVGGRDYNSVDMSERMLWETYLPPFKAALDAGAATFMNSFNDINGIPATGNAHLQRDILKGKWNFQGFVVSDWGSIGEMVAHGYSKNLKEAAYSAITAGSDMDMESNAYRYNLAQLVKEGRVSVDLIDDAVKRILRKKFELGLFDDPYRYSDEKRAEKALNNPEHRKAALDVAQKSIVLLKNENQTLPISKSVKTIAFIGPMVKEYKENMGFWSVELPEVDYNKWIVSQWDGLQNKVGKNTKLLYAKGCEIEGTNKDGFAEAVETAKQADVVILSIGERRDMSGEAKSRSDIHLPGVQEDLVKAIQATGKPVVVLINAGRPLVFNWTADNVPAVVYTWWLGTEAGNAIANVLFGDYNPSGKLPMTFPREVGQIPIYYNHFSTGRPAKTENETNYVSAYIDLKNSPKFPFGYGLSYTQFSYSDLKLSSTKIKSNETIKVSFKLSNVGKVAGEEVAQLYLKDKFGSVVRPVLELRDFEKVKLNAGESKTIEFTIDKEKLSFYNDKLEWTTEPGDFELMIGSSSADIKLRSDFELLEK